MELIHRNLLIGIHDALQETFFEERKYADKVIERLLKAHKQWGSEDRKVVAQIFYDIIRWKKRLEYYMGEGVKPNNIYKMILSYCLWTKIHYKKFEEFDGIKNADIINKAVADGRRVCAVGTTTMRTIETSVSSNRKIGPYHGWTNKFIFPPHDFGVANCMITNFHTPKSTLMMMVAAFAGKDFLMHAYEEAVKNKYKFYSYGDAMLII